MPNPVFTHILNMLFVNTFCRYTQLNDQTVQILTIQFSISHLFALSLNINQFYSTHWQERVRCSHTGPEWTWERWQWRSTLHPLTLLHYWNLTIRLFIVISRTLIGMYYPSAEMQSVYSTVSPANWKTAKIDMSINKETKLKQTCLFPK